MECPGCEVTIFQGRIIPHISLCHRKLRSPPKYTVTPIANTSIQITANNWCSSTGSNQSVIVG